MMHVLIACLLLPTSAFSPKIALTRESPAANTPLTDLLTPLLPPSAALLQLPCISFTTLPPSNPPLATLLTSGSYDYCLITSKEAARVLLEHISPSVRVPQFAAVSLATSLILTAANLTVSFLPSKSTGHHLATELPPATTALYPCSALASTEIETTLKARGCSVTRIDTYTTTTPAWPSGGGTVDVVTFGSPSAGSCAAEAI